MSIQAYFFKECKLLLTVVNDELSDVSFKEHMLRFNEELAALDELRELTDCRWVTKIDNFSIEGIIEALQVQEVKSSCKMAFLVPESNALQHSIANTYKTFAKEKRPVEVFTCFNNAIDWIANDPKDREQLEKVIITFYNNLAWMRIGTDESNESKGIIYL